MVKDLFKSDLSRRLFTLTLWGVGLASVSTAVWTFGPYISIFGWQPLNNYLVREMVVVVIIALMAGGGGFQFYRKRKAAKALAAGIAGTDGKGAETESDAAVLKDKLKDALTTLKNASVGKAEYLYDLPWYVLIGPPGAGKTTALVNSGLKFPLSRGATPAAVAGVGGTRYCDWWFTEDAVLIDTAGRYTTQDSDEKADKQSWFAFLDMLKKNRPRQPINGVIVAISLEDLMTLSTADLDAHANAIRARLLELHDRLKVDFPVYALFTKSDLVAGFMEFFGNLGENGRKQVWGATFQTGDKTRNLVGEVPLEFDALLERLNVDLTDRLQEEPAPSTRVSLFGFPSQMSALKRPIFDFLNAIFEPTRYHANATLRGFYFTSGTQEGTPIDQVIGALAKSFGAQEVASEVYSGRGKSFFLTDLISKVIIGEAAWVSTDRSAVRRAFIIKTAAFAAIALVSLLLSTMWWVSYTRNRALIDATNLAAREYEAAAGPLAKESIISDRELHKVLPLLDRLRAMPAGYGNRKDSTPILATFGLSQRDRLQSSSENAYRIGLERMFRSRLVFRLEEQLEANRSNPSVLYEALKVYMMLGGLQPPERELILSWMRRDWLDNLYQGAANTEGRRRLEEHLVAMLDLEAGYEPLITLHGPLVEDSQRTLARLSVAQRAYELLKSQARANAGPNLRDWTVVRAGGPDVALVFQGERGESLENIKVPAFYTYAGFQRAFIDRLGDISEQVKKERWVLGQVGEQSAVSEQYDRLPDDLLAIYTRDFVSAWREALNKVQMKRLNSDRPKYTPLNAIASPTSPLKQLLESVRDETALTRERPGFKKEEKDAKATSVLLGQQDKAPGLNIENAFKNVHIAVEGDGQRKPVEQIIAVLGEINQSVTLAATNPSQAAQANDQLQRQLALLKNSAARMPPPFAQMMGAAANDFEGDAARDQASQIGQGLREQVTRPCQTIITDRYPFVRGSTKEVPLADFGRLFGPGGILDKFYTQNLAPLADSSKKEWVWRPENRTASTLPVSALKEFQRATEIREAYFATGGSMPALIFAVQPPSLGAPSAPAAPTTPGTPPPPQPSAPASVKMEVNGVTIESKPGPNSPVSVQWPGAAAVGRTAITVQGEAGFGQSAPPPSVLERTGVWSLFRMLEAGAPHKRGDKIIASFVVGGRDLTYQISVGSISNPFDLAKLREFRCPAGL
jgi:type VI secretion system protein ImpL